MIVADLSAPRAAPIATVLRGRAKRKPRVGVSGHPAMAASTSAPFFTVDETALADLNAFLRDARELVRAAGDGIRRRMAPCGKRGQRRIACTMLSQ